MVLTIIFNFSINEKEELKKAINGAKFLKGQTYTAAAMNQAFDDFKARSRKDDTTIKVVIFTRSKFLSSNLIIDISHIDRLIDGLIN